MNNGASADLIWECVKHNSCFIRKQKSNGTIFTKEPGNLMGLNKYKFSGIANPKAVDMSSKKGKVVMKLTNQKKDRHPKTASIPRVLHNDRKKVNSKLYEVAKQRPDLYPVVEKRYFRLRGLQAKKAD